jgi:hypothetical protein
MVHLVHTVPLYCTGTNTVCKRTETRFHDPYHLGLPSCAFKTFFEPLVCLPQTVHLYCVKISTICKRTKTSFHLRLVTYGMFSANMHLYCTNTNIVSKWTKTRFHMTISWRSSIWCVQDDFRAYGTFGTNRAPISVKISTISKRTQTNINLSLVTKGYHQVHPKWFSEPMVRSAQTVHLSCVKISTISKWNETSFLLSLIT